MHLPHCLKRYMRYDRFYCFSVVTFVKGPLLSGGRYFRNFTVINQPKAIFSAKSKIIARDDELYEVF